jgi:Protein of unknown function (DUF1203)
MRWPNPAPERLPARAEDAATSRAATQMSENGARAPKGLSRMNHRHSLGADMGFRITGLPPALFQHLFSLSDDQLAHRGAKRYVARQRPGIPDRIELRDAMPGESVLLVNHVHQPAATPYHASHAIFVLEHAGEAYDRVDHIPEVLRPRVLSLRAFDAAHMMVNADLVDGGQVETLIERMLGNPAVDYVHAHYAKQGCFACRIERS